MILDTNIVKYKCIHSSDFYPHIFFVYFLGYVGKGCLPICELNPCSNSSVCETISQKSSIRKDERTYVCKCDAHHTGAYCETLLDLPCPSNWWGYPICGPCQCDVNKGYSADCNKTTGECVCEVCC